MVAPDGQQHRHDGPTQLILHHISHPGAAIPDQDNDHDLS
jgi:hypothetical protein